jgi:hypothetical protein
LAAHQSRIVITAEVISMIMSSRNNSLALFLTVLVFIVFALSELCVATPDATSASSTQTTTATASTHLPTVENEELKGFIEFLNGIYAQHFPDTDARVIEFVPHLDKKPGHLGPYKVVASKDIKAGTLQK